MTDDTLNSTVVRHTSCDKCGSSDNVAVYADGHEHCFTPGCDHHTPPNNGEGGGTGINRQGGPGVGGTPRGFVRGDHRALPTRGLSLEACRKYGVHVGKLGNDIVIAMDYRDDTGNLIAQKCRTVDKRFTFLGNGRDVGLFGQHLWGSKGRFVVVTEGELDAVSLAQVLDLRWPVVSLPNGAQSAKKAIAKAMEWLLGYEEIVLAFDADEPGRLATAEAAAMFPPGRVKVAEMPAGCKDANEALVKGKTQELITAVRFQARVWRPDGIVRVADIRDRLLADPAKGAPYPWAPVTEATFGRLPGQVIGFGGGTGIGKSDLFATMIDHDVRVLGIPTGVLSLEQAVADTARRIAGKAIGKPLHVPDGSWTPEERDAAVDALTKCPLFLYDSWGAMDWDTIQARIRYMAQVEGCRHIYLDHLTALAAAEDDERKALEAIMAEAASLAQNTGIVLHFVSHLTTPDNGPSHEEGGRVTIRQFKGSRAIGFWSHILWGLERNQQDDDEAERSVTTLRCLKDRHTGRATGKTFKLRYDLATGTLRDITGEFESEADDAGF